MTKFRYLHSVGCYFNVDTLEVSAYSPYDSLDWTRTNVADCDDEWWSRYQELDAIGLGKPGFSDNHVGLTFGSLYTDS